MKNKSILISGIVVVAILVIGGILIFSNKKVESSIKTVDDAKTMFNELYKNLELPALETDEVSVEEENVKAYTGLSSNKNIEKMIVSEPLMNAQAYSAVVLIVKDGSDIEQMKQEIYDNLNMNKWICVSATDLYITNNGNVIFLVMASEDRAKPVYDNFKKFVKDEIGKELHKENKEEDIELPPEITVD